MHSYNNDNDIPTDSADLSYSVTVNDSFESQTGRNTDLNLVSSNRLRPSEELSHRSSLEQWV